jgi:hypothetical protein
MDIYQYSEEEAYAQRSLLKCLEIKVTGFEAKFEEGMVYMLGQAWLSKNPNYAPHS